MCSTCGCHGGQLEKKVLSVEGMSCGHCKSAVEKAALGLPGVMAAEVNLEAKTLTVEFDSSKTALKDIAAAIDDIGFSAVV
jgi:copper chaperone